MVDDHALCVLAADSCAGVHALVVGAGFVVAAVGVLHALGGTPFVGVAAVLAYAAAGSVSTQGVRSAGRRVTWV